MARSFNGSSQYLSASSTLLTNEPIDLVAHGWIANITTDGDVLNMGNSGAASGIYSVRFEGAAAGDPIRNLKQNDSGTSGQAATAVGFSASTWYVLGSTFISDTSRAVYMDGGNKATNTAGVTDPTPDYITIGASRRNALANYLNGYVAEAYVLDVNMTDAQHASAGAGYSPLGWLVPVGNVRGWYPLQVDDNNRVGGGYPDLTATGSPTFVAHPPKVIYPRIGGVITL